MANRLKKTRLIMLLPLAQFEVLSKAIEAKTEEPPHPESLSSRAELNELCI